MSRAVNRSTRTGRATLVAGILTLGLSTVAAGGNDALPSGQQVWMVPALDALRDDAWGRTVRRGHALVAQTSSLIGPKVRDPKRRFAGNNLDCQSCHIEAGTKRFGLPFIGTFADYPQYRARSGVVGTIEERVNGCMTRSMNGKPLPVGGPDMVAIVAYLKFLSTGRPVGGATSGRGTVPLADLSRAANPLHGAAIYRASCAACHGAGGQGLRAGFEGDAKGYAIPPLWGADSFNTGAGMNRLATAASFIRSNMPHGTSWDAPVLGEDEAWDVAAYVLAHNRPQRQGLAKDYPDLREKPVDAPYGPYADRFSPLQHRLGPFPPIRAAIKAMQP